MNEGRRKRVGGVMRIERFGLDWGDVGGGIESVRCRGCSRIGPQREVLENQSSTELTSQEKQEAKVKLYLFNRSAQLMQFSFFSNKFRFFYAALNVFICP